MGFNFLLFAYDLMEIIFFLENINCSKLSILYFYGRELSLKIG